MTLTQHAPSITEHQRCAPIPAWGIAPGKRDAPKPRAKGPIQWLLLALTIALFVAPTNAQTPPGKLSFALPVHPGSLSLNQGKFKVSELSAKSNNGEFGIRAEDGDLHFLGFMFLWPEKPSLNAQTCRDEMLKSEGSDSLVVPADRMMMQSASGTDIAIALIIPKNGKQSAIRAFVASGDLCGDLSFSINKPVTTQQLPMQQIKDILSTVRFDPLAKPSFHDAFGYATVEWSKHQIKGAAIAYQAALNLIDSSEDPTTWRRVTTDQLTMALGMSGDIKQSRAINQAAIGQDAAYPLYYYNLAYADAEEGNAGDARTHLQEAFDRRKNTLKGETMPDPSTDDSFLKLKGNKDFWTFVQGLSAQLKKS